ncbi:hypothetical protein BKA82DRAFT_4020247 [Pisolithus tinctorius]|uniref:Uncharacterized protein n=1 Tax=Pisolithus tinctorius Marx 270 TaxID=870435 RepID=A0A0C3IY05_PISTI|nr:hypothetical protein BKA82DRAFT_4020247 [Pisolithus tinctorius]KIO01708.1 hypothetical protein M404DRAFT_9980 [Pisolithus tinctorius Marx 270]
MAASSPTLSEISVSTNMTLSLMSQPPCVDELPRYDSLHCSDGKLMVTYFCQHNMVWVQVRWFYSHDDIKCYHPRLQIYLAAVDSNQETEDGEQYPMDMHILHVTIADVVEVGQPLVVKDLLSSEL